MAARVISTHTAGTERRDDTYTFEMLDTNMIRLTITVDGTPHVFMIDGRDMQDFALTATDAYYAYKYWNE